MTAASFAAAALAAICCCAAPATAAEVTCFGQRPPTGLPVMEHVVYATAGAELDPAGGVLDIGAWNGMRAALRYGRTEPGVLVHASAGPYADDVGAFYHVPRGSFAPGPVGMVTLLTEYKGLTFTDPAWLAIALGDDAPAGDIRASLATYDDPQLRPLAVAPGDARTVQVRLPDALPTCSLIVLQTTAAK
jgi:hypothetical protein